ncbi:carbohydrate porin [Acidisarcina polymorpha]|uniref:carbohydrate porin n=1 Tax=Acidisarcina polymorpha TaxID=2211140 RepID=UPI001F3FA002|nr:carbohydrate porin [Acidisarcina polymorpha]
MATHSRTKPDAAIFDPPAAAPINWQVAAQETVAAATTGTSQSAEAEAEQPSLVLPMTTMFPHSETWPLWISGQTNIIFQAHPSFHSPYQGRNSFQGAGEYKTSLLGTLYTGLQVPGTHKLLEVLFDEEAAGGRGLSEALGLAGFTNLDVVRNPNLGSVPYVARWVVQGTIPLTSETVEVERGPFSMATTAAVRRLTLHVGKMSIPDLFDQNAVGSDSHLQFTNWAIDNNGAYDYAADTRGYTKGAALEYFDRRWAVRYGIFQMPTVANGINLDWAFSRARGENLEVELELGLLPTKWPGKIRLLSYWNHAHMGVYRQAINAFLDGEDAVPDITRHEHFGAVKYGFGFNTEQQVTPDFRAFARFGWNEGQHESFAYTEIDQTVLFGGDLAGRRWGRPVDKIGVAFVTDGISKDHSQYLKLGGYGFILGDGTLKYGRENILETYYNLHAWRGLFYALGFSFINDPGYNRDRGPAYVPSIRAHVDF